MSLWIVPVGTLLLLILTFVKIGALVWVFYRTGILAAIAYGIYLVIDWLFMPRLTESMVNRIQRNEEMLWLGNMADVRVSNFLFLIRFVSTGIEAVLFIWLLVTLTRSR